MCFIFNATLRVRNNCTFTLLYIELVIELNFSFDLRSFLLNVNNLKKIIFTK